MSNSDSIPACRLYFLLAREARTGVVFRRGPSRQVLLLKWNLVDDTFQSGQWFKGRIYERRCDISPDGEKLIYFAATYKEPLRSWTALSKPPWLTAIALWPKGDGWNGGGYFMDNNSIRLNHPEDQSEIQAGSDLGDIRVKDYATGRGEDDTVHRHLLERGGWLLIQEAIWKKRGSDSSPAFKDLLSFMGNDDMAALMEEHGLDREMLEKAKVSFDFLFGSESTRTSDGWIAEHPEIWRKTHLNQRLCLQSELHAIARKSRNANRNWYDLKFVITTQDGVLLHDLDRLDWADWDANGDLLFAREGALYRAQVLANGISKERQLADFNSLTFEAIPSPDEARKWSS